VTGGEPFLLPDIGEILAACAATAATTVLTNGMLLAGRRLETLRSLPRDRVTLQISLDSPEPARHDRQLRAKQMTIAASISSPAFQSGYCSDSVSVLAPGPAVPFD
jgi:MoaA/NifB/PqqE/SkfB family radical SAM enzyme